MDNSATQRSAAWLPNARGAREGRRISLYNYVAAYFLLDVVALLGGGLAVSSIIDYGIGASGAAKDTFGWAIAFAVVFHLVAARLIDVYSPRTVMKLGDALQRASLSFVCAFMLLLVIAVATKTAEHYSRLWFTCWAALSLALVVMTRLVLVKRLRSQLAQGGYVQRASSIGIFCDPIRSSEIARQTANEIRVFASARLNDIDELTALSDQIAQLEIDQVYIAAPWEHIPLVLRKVSLLRHLSTNMFLLPSDRRICREITQVAKFGDRLSFCAIEQSIYGWSLWFKRIEDLLIGAALLAVLAPAMALIALAIRLDSPGPIFFRQVRTGFNGRNFRLWKFRSMYVHMTDESAQTQTSKGDSRVTRVGRYIRRASIDELPQLFNVLQGDMSIVGPRPHALSTKTDGRNLDELVDYYAIRHRVKPGITGWAQIHGYRGELDSIEKLRARVNYDLAYIDNWTIWLDLEIIFRTAMLVVTGDKHAY